MSSESEPTAPTPAQATTPAQTPPERNDGYVPSETFGPLGVERLRKDDGRLLILYGLPADD